MSNILNTEEGIKEYESVLNIKNDGVMGSISIPSINTELVIYHETTKNSLNYGCEHIASSSLPIGGKGTHSVIAAHSGLSNAKLFDNLDLVKVGDYFYITVLNETRIYQVDQILKVLPYETEALQCVEEKEYVTLVTCTPYSVNTHRLLVRGVYIQTEAV